MRMLALLCVLMVLPAVAAADSECDEIKRVRKLAQAQRLDDTTLASLERTHCVAASLQCEDLTTMSALARAGGIDGRDQRMIDRERSARCSGGGGDERWKWSNGNSAFDGRGWKYPTGAVAMTGKGRWDYPNGATAMKNGRWDYPDGATAKRDGRWSDPRGRSTDVTSLIALACGNDRRACSTLRILYNATPGDAQDAILIAAVWLRPGSDAPPPPPPPPGVDQDACVEWAHAQYNKTYNSADARDRARKNCKLVGDLEIAKLLHGWNNKTYNSGDSTDRALSGATADLAGKREVLMFAFASYNKTFNAGDSAARAVKMAKTVPADATPCLQREYAAYNKSLNSGDSTDKAFANCTRTR